MKACGWISVSALCSSDATFNSLTPRVRAYSAHFLTGEWRLAGFIPVDVEVSTLPFCSAVAILDLRDTLGQQAAGGQFAFTG